MGKLDIILRVLTTVVSVNLSFFSGRYEQTQVALYDAKLLKEGDNQQSQKCDKEQ